MFLEFECPSCGATKTSETIPVGGQYYCRECNSKVIIPGNARRKSEDPARPLRSTSRSEPSSSESPVPEPDETKWSTDEARNGKEPTAAPVVAPPPERDDSEYPTGNGFRVLGCLAIVVGGFVTFFVARSVTRSGMFSSRHEISKEALILIAITLFYNLAIVILCFGLARAISAVKAPK